MSGDDASNGYKSAARFREKLEEAEKENAKLKAELAEKREWLDARNSRIAELEEKLDKAEGELRVAAGYISTLDEFKDKHPQDVLEMIQGWYAESLKKPEEASSAVGSGG